MRKTFLVELDVPDTVRDAEAVGVLYERIFVGQGADHEQLGVRMLQPNAAAFCAANGVVLSLPILTDPPKCPIAMTIHTEGLQNWIQPGVARLNVLGYLAVGTDIPLPMDEDE